jgi:hypothetical protein
MRTKHHIIALCLSAQVRAHRQSLSREEECAAPRHAWRRALMMW